ncbi:MAG: AmmeMemoRadiSam system radical SAM enzyme [Candidatus Omnitrophota bacterium]|nr:AmmeMemoRadiSam system radical SAM enzyme [Candidatus Omnitrophota bacterium]
MNKFYRLIFISIFIAIVIFAVLIVGKESAGGDVDLDLQEASYWQELPEDRVRCELCPNRCILKDGEHGLCTVRQNKGGKLYTLVYGKPCAVHIDPIEKKPFFHVAPSSKAFSIATAGCNLRCIFCQNWQISQAKPEETRHYNLPPVKLIEAVIKNKCRIITYTYTEPTVFYEYMLDTAKLARAQGLFNTMHTCGYINPEPLRELCRYMDAVNIDLKGFNENFYSKMSAGRLAPVLDSLKIVKQAGVWLEITNLIIPKANDDPESIRRMCEWIKENLGKDTPLHFSRFHPQFKLRNLPPTPIEVLEKAREIALDAGLEYVYIGNVPGNPAENTYCPKCEKLLVRRVGYVVSENNIVDNKCKFCGYGIAGEWDILDKGGE